MRTYSKSLLLILAFIGLAGSVTAQDRTVPPDSSLLARYPGSEVTFHAVQDSGSYRLALGPLIRNPDERPRFAETRMLEGRVTRVQYVLQAPANVFDVFDFYKQSLNDLGFRHLVEGRAIHANDVGGANWVTKAYSNLNSRAFDTIAVMGERRRFLASERSRPEGALYVTILAVERDDRDVCVQVDVIEVPPS